MYRSSCCSVENETFPHSPLIRLNWTLAAKFEYLYVTFWSTVYYSKVRTETEAKMVHRSESTFLLHITHTHTHPRISLFSCMQKTHLRTTHRIYLLHGKRLHSFALYGPLSYRTRIGFANSSIHNIKRGKSWCERNKKQHFSLLIALVMLVTIGMEKAYDNFWQVRCPADIFMSVVAALLEPMELDWTPRFAPGV